jgi:hypothetical protein
MKILSKLILIGLVAGFIFSTFSISFAAQKIQLKKKTLVKKTPMTIAQLPDLVFEKKAEWSAIPKAGDTIGSSAMINVFVKNKGIAASGASKMQITLLSFSGGYRPPSLSGTLHIPPLNSGQSFILSWPQLSSAKWLSGKFQFNFKIDPQNQIKESKETNNKDQLLFEIAPIKGKFQLKKNAKINTLKSMSQSASSQALNITGLSIISPKPDTLLYGSRTYTIKYLARGAKKVDVDYLIYRVDDDGNPKDTFRTKSIIKNKVPTGSCDIQINHEMVPSIYYENNSPIGNPLSGHYERFDGKVAIRLKAVINGKEEERICPLRVKRPRIRLVKPESGSDLYRGQWYEARWSTIGYKQDKVELHLLKSEPDQIGFSGYDWSIEVPNTGRCRFKIPVDLQMSPGRVYLEVYEPFRYNLWGIRVFSFKQLTLH